MATTAYIALGSNLGDRDNNIRQAIESLGNHPKISVNKVSTILETEAVGGPKEQDMYCNAAAEIQTTLSPTELLNVLMAVETQLGRERSVRFGPRTIDLDLIFYGEKVLNLPQLKVPHPLMHVRPFVLHPMVEIAADFVHPTLHKSLKQLSEEFDPESIEPWWEQKVSPKDRELRGQRALVTGATNGIGKAIALTLADAGVHVAIHGRNRERAEIVCQDIKDRDRESAVFLADFLEEIDADEFVSNVEKQFGPIDIWINNAGMDTLTGAAADWPFEEKLQTLMSVDVVKTMLLSRAIGKRMVERGHGVILNMGWDQAETGMEGDSGELFAATKGAIMAFTRSLAMSLAPDVRVNCLAPGWIQTSWGEQASEVWQERVMRETPLKRWGTPEDVADTACWLASPQAAFISGQIVRINGGAIR